MGKLNKELRMGIHNRFDIEVVDVKTGEVKQKAQALNVVCNNYWSYLLSGNTGGANYIQYGGGTGTPSASDTSLFSRIGGTTADTISRTVDAVLGVISRVSKITLALSVAVGETITEVGLAASANNGTITTHAMLQDMNGNPISIVKTDTDIINIYATIYVHYGVDSSGTVIINPSDDLIDYLTGKSYFSYYSNRVYFIPEKNNFFFGGSAGAMTIAGDVTNKRITMTKRYTDSEGNLDEGIKYFITESYWGKIALKKGTNSWSGFQVVGENVGEGDGQTTEFNTKHAMPYNATVYVNGVPANDAIVKRTGPNGIVHLYAISDESTLNNIIYDAFSMATVGGSTFPGPWTTHIWYNPQYIDFPVKSVYMTTSQDPNGWPYYWDWIIEVSDDLVTWTEAVPFTHTGPRGPFNPEIPAQYRHSKFFRVSQRVDWWNSNTRQTNLVDFKFYGEDSSNIVFAAPPAEHAIVTVDYTTDSIPKDSAHVIDLTVVLQFGEWTGE